MRNVLYRLALWLVSGGYADGKVGALAEGYALGHLAATDHGRPTA